VRRDTCGGDGVRADLYYFAYGSNLNTKVIVGRRGVKAERAKPCVVDGYSLEFSIPGLPYLEPAFATVVESEGEEVHGVAYFVTTQQWEMIKFTETGYDIAEVDCRSYTGETFKAHTLTFPKAQLRKGLSPSQRYIELIREGAFEWNLAPHWQRKLALESAYVALQGSSQQVGAAVSVGSVLPLAFAIVLGRAASQVLGFREETNQKEQVSLLTADLTKRTWDLHDIVFKSILGDGGSAS